MCYIRMDHKKVEKQLKDVCTKLNETEANINMFGHMIRNGIATNDVRNFVSKQSDMKRMSNKYDQRLSKTAMRRKINDACAQALRLRRMKNDMLLLLTEQYGYSKSKLRNLMNRVKKQNTYHKAQHMTKTINKYKHCEKKMKVVCRRKNNDDIPKEVWEVLEGVELFNEDIEPEPPADPMVCDSSIKLSDEELKFLRRGPRFMLRQKVNLTDFQIELEKMIAKRKYNESNNEDGEDSGISSGESDDEESGTDNDKLEALSERIKAEASMVYMKREKRLDLGKLKVTDYKFNKFVHLPRAQEATSEAKHEVRRAAMERVFKETFPGCNKYPEDKGKDSKRKKDTRHQTSREKEKEKKQNTQRRENCSNLSEDEMKGLEKLKKRVQAGELVVTETDKSRRFCVLSPQQYIDSGMKHTKGDIEISHDQLASIQKTVNDHSTWMRRIFGVGKCWDHEERLDHSMTDRGEVVAPLRLLIKDHKGWSQGKESGPPPSRPVCSGNKGFNRHLSEILSMILESIGHSIGGNEIDSTGELLCKVGELNSQLDAEKSVGKNFGEGSIVPERGNDEHQVGKNFGEGSIASAEQAEATSIGKNFGESSICPFGQENKYTLGKNFGESSISPAK